MKKKMLAPKTAKELAEPLLSICGITKEELLCQARADLNKEGEFAKGFVLLTKEAIYVFSAPIHTGEVLYYKSYFENPEPAGDYDWTYEKVDLSKV